MNKNLTLRVPKFKNALSYQARKVCQISLKEYFKNLIKNLAIFKLDVVIFLIIIYDIHCYFLYLLYQVR